MCKMGENIHTSCKVRTHCNFHYMRVCMCICDEDFSIALKLAFSKFFRLKMAINIFINRDTKSFTFSGIFNVNKLCSFFLKTPVDIRIMIPLLWHCSSRKSTLQIVCKMNQFKCINMLTHRKGKLPPFLLNSIYR